MTESVKQKQGTVYGLRCEYADNPVGLGEVVPRLSWRLRDARLGACQTAWQVQVDVSQEDLLRGRAQLWESGRVEGRQSLFVPYGGPALTSRQRCWWRVRIWGQDGVSSDWSAPAFWEMGLLEVSDWQAHWIQSALVGGPRTPVSSPFFRRTFVLVSKPVRARLYVSACGLYECSLNGIRLGDREFRPGRTDYEVRIQYDTFDITAGLKRGENVLGAILGDGWYCGHTGSRDRQRYGDRPALLAQVEIAWADGSSVCLTTDETWCWTSGPILESDLLMGEAYDARRELPGWNCPGYDAKDWLPAQTRSEPSFRLVAPQQPPVRAVAILRPVEEPYKLSEGRYRFDLGQNFAGRVRMCGLRAPAGHTVRLRYAEMLYPNGELYTENLRSARATDYYTCGGAATGEPPWEPRFTYHGFRYVELTNLPAGFTPSRETVTGVVLQSDTPSTGEFACSDPLLNRLHSNIQWSQRGNFLEIPTDCPQRDERQGWTGDAQIFIRHACFNMDVSGFFAKWQDDLLDAQRADGAIPGVVPDTGIGHSPPHREPIHPGDAGPAWSDAIVICPWTLYRCYDDKRILERHYESLQLYMSFLESNSYEDIRRHALHFRWGGFGDWLAMDCQSENHWTPTPKELIGTAYYARLADIMRQIATVLERGEEEVLRWERLRDRIKEAFNREFVTPVGRVQGGNQTSYLLALAFDLLPEEKRGYALQHLLKCLERSDWHLTTGFVGTPLLCSTLSRFGYVEEAYRVLQQKTYPGWLYSVLQGATTVWERWNSYSHEKGFGPVDMNSFNHYAYGAVGEWMVATIAGLDLDPDVPAFQRSLLRPRPGGDLTFARASLQTPYGLLSTDWKLEDGVFTLNAVVPPNTSAIVSLPATTSAKVTCNRGTAEKATGVEELQRSNEEARYNVVAGSYCFRVKPA